jgi:SAM-dependent methyltransferase
MIRGRLSRENKSVAVAGSEAFPGIKDTLTERLRTRFFRDEDHPYRLLEREIEQRTRPDCVLLDAGCGRHADLLRRFSSVIRAGIGIDMVTFLSTAPDPKITLLNGDLSRIELASESVDLVVSRSVMEHLEDPLRVYQEILRVLRPGGSFIFLTPNLWDYSAIISKIIPNRFHSAIVRKVEGRDEKDTFAVFYRSNTTSAVNRLAQQSGFRVDSIRFVGQYPCYLMFNPALFLLGTGYEKLISRFEVLRKLRGWLMVVLTKPSPAAP